MDGKGDLTSNWEFLKQQWQRITNWQQDWIKRVKRFV